MLLRQLHGWVESVLKLYRAVHCELDATEGLEMDNDFPLSLYQGGGDRARPPTCEERNLQFSLT